MNGTLLGGFKIQLNDGNGNPLSAIGRVCFYKAGTLAGSSVPLEVYSSKAMDVSLGTTVYSDAKGYLPDVWLRTDYLYDVRVERKVQDDPETWVKEYDVYNVGTLDDAYTGAYNENLTFAANISALKSVNFLKFKNVFVAGFYEPGDWGEPSLFVFDSESRKTSNGSSYVLPDALQERNSGRWIQKFSGSLIDVRKFGAIPDLVATPNILSQIVDCITYCIDNTTQSDPLSVGFLKSGKYQFSGNLDLDQYHYTYSDGSTKKVFFEIREGVIFCSLSANGGDITIGQNTNCRSMYKITDSNTTLVLPDYIQYPIYSPWGAASNPNHAIVIFGQNDIARKPDLGFAFDLKYGRFYSDYIDVEDMVNVGDYSFSKNGIFKSLTNNVFHIDAQHNIVFDCLKTIVPQLTNTNGSKSYEVNVDDIKLVDQTDASNVKVTTITAEKVETDGEVKCDTSKSNTSNTKRLIVDSSITDVTSNIVVPFFKVSEFISKYSCSWSKEDDGSGCKITIDIRDISRTFYNVDGELVVIVNDIEGVRFDEATINPCNEVILKYNSGVEEYSSVLHDDGTIESYHDTDYWDSITIPRNCSKMFMSYKNHIDGGVSKKSFTPLD